MMLLKIMMMLRRRMGPGEVGGGGRVSEVSPAAALGVQRPVVRHGLALRQRGRRRFIAGRRCVQGLSVVFLPGAGAAAPESEHGAEIPQQLVGAPLVGGGGVDPLCRTTAVLVVVFDLKVLAGSGGSLALVTPIDSLRNKLRW